MKYELGIMVMAGTSAPRNAARPVAIGRSGRDRKVWIEYFVKRSMLFRAIDGYEMHHPLPRDSMKFVMYCLSPRRVPDRPLRSSPRWSHVAVGTRCGGESSW